MRTEGGVNKIQAPNGNPEPAGSVSHLSDKMCTSVSKDHSEWYFTETKGQMGEIVALG